MLKKAFLGLFLATSAILPFAGSQLAASDLPSQENHLARINWNININTFGGGYGPCCYPCYGYPYPPPPPCFYAPPPPPYWYW